MVSLKKLTKMNLKKFQNSLLKRDQYFILKDFDSYRSSQAKANKAYQDQESWIEKTIINTAKSGYFSTDRTISEYNKDIWKLKELK